ncbi:hypothetical protein DQY68_26635, partial [Salmonella enterica subsp. salamae]|nr:hypothetical protein [Salmonella enterica subsp. salamae]
GVQLADLTNNSPLTVTAPELAVSYQSGTLSNATLNVSGNTTMSGQQDLTLTNVTLNGEAGNLSVTTGGTFTAGPGTNLTAGNIALNGNGVTLNGTSTGVVVNATTGNLTLTSSGSGNLDNGGGDITLQAAQDISLTVNSSYAGTAMNLSGLNISAGNNLLLNATSSAGNGDNYNVIVMSGGNLTATTGNLAISATGKHSNALAAVINLGNSATLTAGQDITLNGSTTGNGNGVSLDNVSLNATTLNLTGSSQGGTGFSLTNITLSQALKDLANVTLSSAGSSAKTTNLLDYSVINAALTGKTLDTFLSRGADNLTQIEMNGTAVFSNTSSGWTEDYSNASKPDGGWLLNNTCVTAGGDVNLSGMGFSNTNLSLTSGNLTLSNTGDLQLSDSNVTLTNGSMNLSTTQGDLSLSGTTVQTGGGAISLGNASAANTTLSLLNSTLNTTSSTEDGTAGAISLAAGAGAQGNGILVRDS